MKSHKLSVVVPVYNEEANILLLVDELESRLAPLGIPYEIVLVDDGSTDGTKKVVNALSERHSEIVPVSYYPNRGRGYAMRQGFSASTGDIVVTIDADLSYSPDQIEHLVQPLLERDDVDIVVGSPYMKGGGTEKVPFFRLLVSRLGNMVLGLSFKGNIHTFTGIFRSYRKKVLDSLLLESDGKDIHLEILSKALACGYRVVEVPAVLRGRKKGKSKFRIGSTTRSHLVFSMIERPALIFGFIGLFILLLGLGVGIYLYVLFRQGALNPERPLVNLTIILLLAGFQILSLGFLGVQMVILRKELFKVQWQNRLLEKRLEERQNAKE
ncbi:MAG: hypothetical protein B6D65_04140 [candidate division Zixibacteria bacterium 4484_93]|nr:MAG: hypothetical protein B6D65_04140 [candidate division Zixibacteria bacterium 4484_93]